MLGFPVKEKKTLDNDLCFDYIYNIKGKESLMTNYDEVFNIANKNLPVHEIIRIKEHKQKVKLPQSNMDAIFGVIHDRNDLDNYEINILFNESLYDEVL